MKIVAKVVIVGLVLAGVFATTLPTNAQDTTEQRLKALEDRIRQQDEEIDKLKRDLAENGLPATLDEELEHYLSKVEDAEWWQKQGTLRPEFGTGLKLTSADKAWEVKIGGRIMDDWTWTWGDDSDSDDPGMTYPDLYFDQLHEFRRARVFLAGTLYENVTFKAQYDFAKSIDVEFKDVWMGLKNLPWVNNLRVGNQKEPFSLEQQTSSKYITFMERSMMDDAFVPGRGVGAMIFNDYYDDQLGWALGWFHQNVPSGRQSKNITARIWGRPWVNDDCPGFLHLGAAYSHRDFQDDRVGLRFRPEIHTFGRVLDTAVDFGLISDANDGADLIGLEAAFVYGPFSFQTEATWYSFNSDAADDPSLFGFYAYLSFFITGESRPYKDGSFGRIKVNDAFHTGDGGAGAWEFAVRYSYVDFEDGNFYDIDDMAAEGFTYKEGSVSNWTIGLNWYLNRNMRLMMNYVNSEVDGLEDAITAFMMRFQIDF